MKTHVYTMERTRSCPFPEIPCPLVHPHPSALPKPTSAPATIARGASTMGTAACAPKIIGAMYPAATRPSKNDAFVASPRPCAKAFVSPETPKFFPALSRFATTIDPRTRPPANAESGVNCKFITGP